MSLRRGFTMVEVMMAVVIIGLGVLGLLALFAGAARQQQLAGQQSSVMQATQNALARMEMRFGSITPEAVGTQFDDGVWYAAKSNGEAFGDQIILAGTGSGARDIYSQVQAEPLTLYSRGTDTTTISTFPCGPGSLPPVMNSAVDFGFRRLEPDSVVLTAVFASPAGGTETQVTYRRATDPTLDGISQPPNFIAYFPDGDASVAPPNYIVVDIQEDPPEGIPLAALRGMCLAVTTDPTTTVLERIDVGSFLWRSTTLLSLRDRLIMREDPAVGGPTWPDPAPYGPGQRPEIAFSLLYRRTATASQLAVVSYTMTPATVARPYVPPERRTNIYDGLTPSSDSRVAPLGFVNMTLGWDTTEESYYLQTTNSAAAWAIEQGQLLLVQSGPDPAGGGGQIGSDHAVRVVRSITGPRTDLTPPMPSGTIRAYLDDSPRANFRSYLRSRTSTPVTVSVWAVRDSVESACGTCGDADRWRLRPLDIQVIQLNN
ncbi:MAG TPA: prepilin-type N-terminal cleavage/methylation domain-containing protein [Phycisphaerales bacterium]|nr:prepilin-type N-terminal cleavage/methylation domain-containing protein [Phycisphaerales bacterium]